MTTGHYLRSMKQLTRQWTPTNFRDERRQRLYLKDIDCPREWQDVLQKLISPSLYYLSESVDESANTESEDGDERPERNPAPAGDLMSSLPVEMRAENLMCYIGHEGTYTPAHREMCASLGQNIMVEASGSMDGETPGSSIWFMTEGKEREVVREYFLSMLGHDIEIEKHFAQINAWKKAPFGVHVVEQRQGDFILIPPLAAHQVWNRGTRTMKVAWNRTTVETLELALQEALPKARLVCRDEQYKNKAIIYYTLEKYYKELRNMDKPASLTEFGFANLEQNIIRNSPRAKQLMADFRKLFGLFTQVLVDEVFVFKEKDVEFIPFDSCITCSYCRSNIFNRFLTCKHCVRTLINGDEDTYDVCMECYAMGRSCACLSGLQFCEQWHWNELVDSYETWRAEVIMNDGFIDIDQSPPPLEVARQRNGKKTVAQICQEALRRRPWKDITQPEKEDTPSDSGLEPDDEAAKKKAKNKKKKKKRGQLERCHVCCHKDYSYRVQKCTNAGCSEFYCYGVLYRAFDMMPQSVLEDENWQCPKCLGICNCGHCRRAGNANAYMPKNTSLGHDTRRVADDRSVEALVDFRLHNLSWLKATGEESRSRNTRRMQRLREQADHAKADAGNDANVENAMRVESIQPTGDQTSEANGHDQALQGPGPSDIHDAGAGSDIAQDGAEHALANLASAESNTMAHEEPASSYPDPSIFGHQRIGMGYYEQDDTPDKILFDPYQAPAADALHHDNQSDIPEFVKKSIRAAKRKAKKDNEDPDFIVRSKRYRSAPEPDFLASMDPALFSEPSASAQNGQEMANNTGMPRSPGEGEKQQPLPESTNRTPASASGVMRYDANEPVLRHAKPKTSYVEVDDAGVEGAEVFDQEIEEIQETASSTAGRSNEKGGLPADDAQDISMPDDEQEAQTHTRVKESVKENVSTTKRRGRPPKHAAQRDSKAAAAEVSKGEQASPGQERYEKRRSARQEDDSLSQAEMQGSDHEIRRRPGRPARHSSVTAQTPEQEEHQPTRRPTNPTRGRRGKRGRARRSEATSRPIPDKRDATPTPNEQFMSLAERMALRGKKFKIGKRNTPSKSAPGPTHNSNTTPERAESGLGIEVRVAAGPARDPETGRGWVSVNRGAERQRSATVVRLSGGRSGSEGSIAGSESGSNSSDDEDIPARVVESSRTRGGGGRGRGSSRGRGRGRGRPRGRPSGSSR